MFDETPATAAPVESTPTPEAPAAPEQPTAPESTPSAFKLVTDESGERHIQAFDGNVPEAPQTELSSGTAPQQYTEDEFVQALSMGQVDESRIGEGQKAAFTAYQKAQQIAAFRQQEAIAQQQAQKAQQEAAQRKMEAVNNISLAAKAEALKSLNMSEEQFADALNYDMNAEDLRQRFKDAYNQSMEKLQHDYIAQEIQAENVRNENSLAMSEVQRFAAEQMKADPHGQEIFSLMDKLYPTLAYQDSVKVQQVIQKMQTGQLTRNDLGLLKAYYDVCKKEVYKKVNGVTTTPQPTKRPAVPYTEQSNGAYTSGTKKTDFSVMRTMSAGDRSDFLQNYFRSFNR